MSFILGESLDSYLDTLQANVSSAADCIGQGQAVTVLSWVTKALVLRGHPKAKQFVDTVQK